MVQFSGSAIQLVYTSSAIARFLQHLLIASYMVDSLTVRVSTVGLIGEWDVAPLVTNASRLVVVTNDMHEIDFISFGIEGLVLSEGSGMSFLRK